mmetsp:Transcript_28047/g.51790  ORF Transcript_28047/g.51790 Transcript_28047/m.51790 type:complete len:209 (-) Transcript_28047:954-1580(-)
MCVPFALTATFRMGAEVFRAEWMSVNPFESTTFSCPLWNPTTKNAPFRLYATVWPFSTWLPGIAAVAPRALLNWRVHVTRCARESHCWIVPFLPNATNSGFAGWATISITFAINVSRMVRPVRLEASNSSKLPEGTERNRFSRVATMKSGTMKRLRVSAAPTLARRSGSTLEKAMEAMGPAARSSNQATMRRSGSKKRTNPSSPPLTM